MKVLTFFLNRENCIDITNRLLLLLDVKVTANTLEKDLSGHPDYPSLLSISDVLAGYGVENISIKTTMDKLSKMPVPFIVPINSEFNNNLFAVIESVNDHTIRYYDQEKHHWGDISKENFEKRWPSGIVLLTDAEYAVGEKEYVTKFRKEKRLNVAKYATWSILPVFTIFACVSTFTKYSSIADFPIIFTLLTLFGCVLGGLLIWYELDQYNPILRQICGAGKKINCGAILSSKASKIAGISWSTIGFTYFAGGLFILLFAGITNVYALFFLAWLNVFAIPYVLFSVYYQWQIAKQWCVLCLCVQGLLVLQLVTTLIEKWHFAASIDAVFSREMIILVLFAYTIPFIVVNLLLTAYRSAKESKSSKSELQRLKHNPQIFEALLSKQKAITESTDGLGILIGNPEAPHKIIKVCSPYCGACIEAHKPLEELLHHNPDVQLQILFTATNLEGDITALPVKHLLAIAEKGETLTRQALDSWYLAEKKDYAAFAIKYPMNGELKQQDDKVNDMKDWCDKTGISFTPTFFVNGYQLPEIYNVSDLKYFLSV